MLVDFLLVVECLWCKWGDCFVIDYDEIFSFIYGKQVIIFICYFMLGCSEEDIQVEFCYFEQIEVIDIEGIVVLLEVLVLLNMFNEVGILWVIVIFGLILVVYVCYCVVGLLMFEVFVIVEQVKYGKLVLDVYLLGVEWLGLFVGECVVVEDVLVGFFFGLVVGCCIIVVNVFVDVFCLDEVDFVLSSLEDLVVECQIDGVVNVCFKV